MLDVAADANTNVSTILVTNVVVVAVSAISITVSESMSRDFK